jgi:hypothetical protein
MFDVRDIETSIKATWIGRWKRENEKPDYSGALIMRGREMMADRIGVDTAMIGNMVILRNIVDRWEIFKGKFYEIGNNVLESLLFGNPTHVRENLPVEVAVFGREGAGNLGERTLNIRVRELLNAQCQVKEKREVGMLFGRDLNWAEYFRLREKITRIKQDYVITSMVKENQTDLEVFVMRHKKGCKRYRNVLTGKASSLYVNSDLRQITAGRHTRGGFGVE